MRVKHVVAHLPLVSGACSKLKLFWSRITASRLTTIYFVFSIVNCLVQVFLQGDAYLINNRAAESLSNIVTKGNSTAQGFYVWQHQQLRFCDFVPNNIDSSQCELVWQPRVADAATTPASSSSYNSAATTNAVYVAAASASASASASIVVGQTSVSAATSPTSSAARPAATVVVNSDSDAEDDDTVEIILPRAVDPFSVQILAGNGNGSLPVVLNGWGYDNTQILLSTDCLVALNWPVQQLENTKREDIAFTSFQFWVLGMSIVAILNESIPHIIASLLTHLSATAWGGFQLAQTRSFQRQFGAVITDGVCGHSLLPTYWTARGNVEIPSLVLNCVSLCVSVFLSWRLIKTFGWQTFKRVGASRTINRMYKLVLTLSVTIQLSLFFVIVSVALWLDQICNGAIGRLATAHTTYEAVLAVVLVLLPVWLTTGWFAVRREMKTAMTIFLVLCVAYMGGWGGMFDSTTFRWTISQWSFFAVMIVVGVILVIICFVVGILCRLNFGRGLPHYLNAEEPLPGDDFERVVPSEKYAYSADPEKIDFPSTFGNIPTYEAAFGDDVPPPPGARTLGPRFYMQDNAMLSVDPSQLAGPEPVLASFAPPPTYSAAAAPASVGHGSNESIGAADVASMMMGHNRSNSGRSSRSGLPPSVRPLVRKTSAASQMSYASTRSGRSTNETSISMGKEMRTRWVIE